MKAGVSIHVFRVSTRQSIKTDVNQNISFRGIMIISLQRKFVNEIKRYVYNSLLGSNSHKRTDYQNWDDFVNNTKCYDDGKQYQ